MSKQNKLPAFRERLNTLLIHSGQTIAAFAEMLGTSRQSLGYYLNGERVPDAVMVRQIAERCHVSADWLLGLSDVKLPDSDVQAVSRYTGLTEGTIKYFKTMKESNHSNNLKLINAFLSDWKSGLKLMVSLEHLYHAYSIKMYDRIHENSANINIEEIEDKAELLEAIYQKYEKDRNLEFEQFLSKKEMNEALEALLESDELYALYREETGNSWY